MANPFKLYLSSLICNLYLPILEIKHNVENISECSEQNSRALDDLSQSVAQVCQRVDKTLNAIKQRNSNKRVSQSSEEIMSPPNSNITTSDQNIATKSTSPRRSSTTDARKQNLTQSDNKPNIKLRKDKKVCRNAYGFKAFSTYWEFDNRFSFTNGDGSRTHTAEHGNILFIK